MAQNLYSLGLLRNGKVYANKEIAYQAMTQAATNDGVAKLCRYLSPVDGGDPIIKTLVGFYANANEMTDNGGGQSYYTIIDVEGNASDIETLKDAVQAINGIIGSGISAKTLTEAINDLNDSLGSGFSESHTVADALEELESTLTEALTVRIDSTSSSAEYIVYQGNTEIGRIKKDVVIQSGSIVNGYWSGDTFTEDVTGPDKAIKLVLVNGEIIYINAKDLVDVYTAGDGIDVINNVIAIKRNAESEDFLIVDANGIKVQGIQAAIDAVKLEAGDGISIESKKINAVAADYSAPSVKNPITVDEDGIKFDSLLDCGYFDSI